MPHDRYLAPSVLAVVLASLAGTITPVARSAERSAPPAALNAVEALRAVNPGVGVYEHGGRITSVYGRAFSSGATAQASVDGFLARHAGVIGVPPGQLVPGTLAADGVSVREIYPNPDGSLKFTMTEYVQQVDGVPVFRSVVKFLTRNEAGNPLVLVRADLRPMDGFVPDAGTLNKPAIDNALRMAEMRLPSIRGGTFTVPEFVIWAGVDDETVAPRLALRFEATKGQPWEEGYAKWLVIADAATGATLWTENQIFHVDVNGRVQGQGTLGFKSAECNPEGTLPMPYARVTLGATTVFADAEGFFSIPNPGVTDVTVSTSPRGQFFRVYNPSVDAPTSSLTVTPPGPANFMLNADNTDQVRRAEVNAYYHSNLIRDLVVRVAPTFPTIPGQTSFRINVAVSGTCNAFYDGSSINFYNNGGGCANTAFSDVVHHEYGHHVVAVAGSGQGQYGEGTGDIMGVLLNDQPVLGFGFQNNCNAGIRSAANTIQYPCGDAIHFCGQLISGCVWDTRNAMVNAGVSDYRDILARLAINAVTLHTGTQITPQITIDWLTLDDNDANIGNGTPNYGYINAGFSAHNMAAPPLDLLDFTYPEGIPISLTPGQTTPLRVDVVGLAGTPQPGTGTVHYSIGGGAFSSAAMTHLGNNQYLASLPAASCLSTVRFYVSAQTTSGVTESDPDGGQASARSLPVAFTYDTPFNDNAETTNGWTATSSGATDGFWQRGIPAGDGTRGDPRTDADGSGACWLTGNRAGNSDIDGGTVTLTSRVMDATGPNPTISYWRWFTNHIPGVNNTRDDRFIVEISGNGGSSWVNLETVGPTTGEITGGWYYRTFSIPQAQATSSFRIRFIAEDIGTGSIVEAAVDGIRLATADCTPPAPCEADFNGDGFVDFFDLDAYIACFEGQGCPDGRNADFNGDGFIDFFDLDAYVDSFEAGCE
ncbi:MAG: hypothetical protein HRU70_14095 [Phycisphaeraceae bacterium]|nr:MAG: hypothetical protein HRU70_14095 [Phycisphaeraceae bacterium]